MSGLKVCILGSAHPFRGGLAAYNERLGTEFQNAVNEVVIHTFTTQYPSILFPGKSQYSEEAAPQHLKIERTISSINPLNWILKGRMLARHSFDLVIVKYWLPFMGPCFGTVIRQIRKNKSTRVIAILDNIIPHEKRPGDGPFTRYFIKPIDGFIAMSESVKTDLLKFTTLKPCLISPHPVFDNFGEPVDKHEAREKLHIAPNAKLVLFFGFIRKYKGLALLLKAFQNEKIKNSHIHLLIAGEFYTDSKEYDEMIESMQLGKRIHRHHKFIPDSEVATYFSAADLIVQPYLSATQSGVTQIAYQFERPMIVTNVGGLPEMVPDGEVGYVVPVNENAIAEAMFDFFNSGNPEKFRTGLLSKKEFYSWNKLRERILDLSGLN